jgi:proline iminopeptidase
MQGSDDQQCPDLEYVEERLIDVSGGRIWCGVHGTGTKPPVVTVHGGPGGTHYPYVPFMEQLAAEDDRTVIFYDQLGCGRSERPSDPSLWSVERYRDELETVVDSLRLGSYHLWGHSWGTQLALNYAAKDSEGLLSLTLASPIIDSPAYRQDIAALLEALPRDVQEGIRKHEPGSEEYLRALSAFNNKHFLTLDPWPECWARAVSEEEFGADSFSTMHGPDLLNCTGSLKDRDDSHLLAKVDAPIWFNCGAADIATPARCMEYGRRVPGSETAIFQNSSHAPFDEEREAYVKAFKGFLNRHDR